MFTNSNSKTTMIKPNPKLHSEQSETAQRSKSSLGQTGESPAIGYGSLLQMRSLYGNRALAGMLGSSHRVKQFRRGSNHASEAPLQMHKGDSDSAKPSKEELVQQLRQAEDGPAQYVALEQQYKDNEPALSALAEANAQLESEVEQLKQRGDILYGSTPLTEQEGMIILNRIEQGYDDVLNSLVQVDKPYVEENARKHEWGLGRAKTKTGEALLIIGGTDYVDWSGLTDCLTAIAHAHPYFKNGNPRDHRGAIRLDTKEIADHPDTLGHKGMVRWDNLEKKQNGTGREVSKIFPSASDIEFCAGKRIRKHTVYTPYVVVHHPKAGYLVVNPDLTPKWQDVPRLRFEIMDAVKADVGHTQADEEKITSTSVNASQEVNSGGSSSDKSTSEKNGEEESSVKKSVFPPADKYECTMIAYGADKIWEAKVSTFGAGQFGLLKW